MKVNVPISLGELLDKISILEIKNKKILNKSKNLNIKKELKGLKNVLSGLGINLSETNKLYSELYKINLTLWEIEDSIRVLEKNEDFGEKFIELSRDVHFKNDIRAQIKKEINLLTDSIIVEEKEYSKY